MVASRSARERKAAVEAGPLATVKIDLDDQKQFLYKIGCSVCRAKGHRKWSAYRPGGDNGYMAAMDRWIFHLVEKHPGADAPCLAYVDAARQRLHQRRAHVVQSGRAPTPFTADEIRAGCPAGRTIRMRVDTEGEAPFLRVSRFVSCDEEGAVLERSRQSLEGVALGVVEADRVTWRDLQAHASFPVEAATIEDETISTAIGDLDCLRYTVRDKETEEVFWFAKGLPGMPIRYVTRAGGEVVATVSVVDNTMQADDPGPFFHGTKAELQPGDVLEPGYASNFGSGTTANFIYLTATLDAATWGAELAAGEAPGRIYRVEPTGPFENDPNLTDKKFPGNPTRSYRTRGPLRVVAEVQGWEPHPAEALQTMRDHLEELKGRGVEAIND